MADNAQDIINDKGMEAIKEVEKAAKNMEISQEDKEWYIYSLQIVIEKKKHCTCNHRDNASSFVK